MCARARVRRDGGGGVEGGWGGGGKRSSPRSYRFETSCSIRHNTNNLITKHNYKNCRKEPLRTCSNAQLA